MRFSVFSATNPLYEGFRVMLRKLLSILYVLKSFFFRSNRSVERKKTEIEDVEVPSERYTLW